MHSKASKDKTTTRQRHKGMEESQKEALAESHFEQRPTSPQERSNESNESGGTFLLVSCFLGIFVSYFIYGLLQEKM